MNPIARSLAAPWRIVAFLAIAFASAAGAQPAAAPPSEALVTSKEMTLTRADWDAELARIPPDMRAPVASSPQRVQQMFNLLLVNKTLAARARAASLQNDPEVQQRIASETNKVLATVMMERIEAEAGAAFDKDSAGSTQRAREIYLAETKRFTVPEEVEVTHILFAIGEQTPEQALAKAKAAREKAVAGADFNLLAVELSDDPSAKSNRGTFRFPRGKMDPKFEEAAFAQTRVGEISEPVLTRFGYHLIRHDATFPARTKTFDEVKPQIVAELRAAQLRKAREDTINAIRTDPSLKPNQAALDSLVVAPPPIPSGIPDASVIAPKPAPR